MNQEELRAALAPPQDRAADEPTFDELLAYREGHLSPADEASLRERIVASPAAIATLTALDAETADLPPVSEHELAAVKRLVRPPAARRWGRSTAVAAGFVVTLLGAALLWQRNVDLESQLAAERTPEADVAIVELHRPVRDAQPQSPIPVARDRSTLFLITTDPDVPYTGFRLDIIDAEGRLVLQLDDLPRNRFGELNFRLPAKAIPAGVYEIRLLGVNGETTETVETSHVRFLADP